MGARRSFFLNSKRDDFTDLSAEMQRSDPVDVCCGSPANDNTPVRVRLSAHCRALLVRLIAMHRLNN
jgi:hypothetical protein